MNGAAAPAGADAGEEAMLVELRNKMLSGQKEDVIRHLQSLPQDEADKLRWRLVKDLERISKRNSKPTKKAAAASPVRAAKVGAAAAAAAGVGASAGASARAAVDEAGEDEEVAAKGSSKSARVIMNRYQIGEAIGKGGFATVYRALDTERGDFVAVKEIEKRLLAVDQLPKIMQEAELLKKLSHPNIVAFRGSHEGAKAVHFVLEFVEGGSLYRVVKKFGLFTEKLCAIYMRQVLTGLQYLHEQGVIHRDIKGANLLLTKEGQVKLADFGACTYAALNKNLTVVGTPFWMAPEIIEIAGGSIGTAADIWSLGCTVLELMTGTPPYFQLGTMQALFKMVEDPHPPFPDTLSPELRDFLLQCFQKDVKKRPTAKQLQAHAWIVKNAAQTQRMTRDQLQGTLRSLNKPAKSSARDLFSGAAGGPPLDAEDKAATAKLQQTKQAIKALRAEQQAVQMEIVAAQKKKAALEQSIAQLRSKSKQ